MDLKQVRTESIQAAKKIGVEIPPTLPLLDSELEIRSADEVASRILVLHAVAASAYGFDKTKVASWLKQEALSDSLSKQEKRFVVDGSGQADRFKTQVESIWALAWAMGVVKELNFTKDCDDSFVAQLPNLRWNQSSADFRKKINSRPLKEIVSACDLAYCLHWAIRQSEIDGKPLAGNLKPYVVIERRRALEWLLSNEEWDDVPLDT